MQADKESVSDFLVSPYVRASHVGGYVCITIVHLHVKHSFLFDLLGGHICNNKSTYTRSAYIRDF